ncbi:MAG: PAS domain S-box protein [Pyrinomonadaceae bacterium]
MKGKQKGSQTQTPPTDASADDVGPAGVVEAVSRLQTVPSILKAVADLTQMRFVVIAKVTNHKWIACAVLDEMDFGLPPGGELEVATTLCSEVRDHRNAIVIENASTDPVYCEHPTPKKYGIESYIAVPITLKNGEFFGTLCAVDSRPADLSGATILDSMRLFAELVANELSTEAAYDALIVSETKRRESENRVRAVTDAMPGLISYIDREYRYQFVNLAYTEWFGLQPDDIINKSVSDVFGKAIFENAKPHIDLAFEGRSETFESEITYRKQGSRTIRVSYTPDVLDGDVRGIFVLVVDISEEKLALDAVNRSEERYRAFITQSTEGIWRFELERPIPTHLTTEEQVQLSYAYGYLAECNDAMAKQYGFSSAVEIVGARLSDLLVADDPKNVEFLKAFIESDYNLSEAESHEKDADGNDRYFLNNFVGIVEKGFLLRAWGTQRDITATKLAGDATSRLAAIVVSSEDAIISKDLMGNITSWNIGATKMFGYRAQEVIGKPITMLLPPDRAKESGDILRRIRREESVEHFETIRRRKDGSDIMVSLTVSPIRNAEGNVVGASKIVRDITDRKRIEEAIDHNQMMLTLAMQSSRMGVWELDLATNTVSWSEELEAIFGLEKGSFGGSEEHFYALMHEDDRDAAWAEVRKAVSDHCDYTIEFRFHHADGSVRWMEGRGEAVYSQKGEAVRLYGVGIDITDRKLAEKALRDSERRFSRFMQHLPGLAWIKDLEGRYVYANESAEKSFGVSGGKLYGKTDEEIFSAKTAEQFRRHDMRAMESSTGIQIAESLIENDGLLHHSIVSKFPIIGSDGKPALIGGMAIDVTDQKQAESALRQRMDFDEAVMRNMGEGLYTVDAGGLVTSMNPAAEDLFGWTFEELSGRSVHELTHYKHRDGTPFPAEECAAQKVFRDGESLVDHEDVFIRRDGSFFDVLYSSSPLREDEKIAGLVVVFTDITERKNGEQRLLLQEEISELIRTVATADELMYAVAAAIGSHLQVDRALFNEIRLDKDLEIVHRDYCAEGVASVSGTHSVSAYSPVTSSEMQAGKTVVNRASRTDERRAEHYQKSYEANGERSYIAIPLLRSGDWVASLWISDDKPRNWLKEDVGMLETICERTWAAVEKMRIDAALRESQERFAKAFNSGPLVFTLSSLKDGRLIEVNDTFVQVTGYSRQEALGKTSVDLGLWENTADREAEMNLVRTAGQVRDLEYTFHTRDGDEIIGLLSAERIEIGGEPFALTVIQDITDRKRSQEALLKAERQGAEEYQELLGRIVPLAATLGRARDLTSIYRAVREFICASMTCSGFFVSFFEVETSLRHAAYVWGEGEEVDIAELPPMPLMSEGGGANSRAVFERRTIITNQYWDDMKNRPHLVIRQNGIDPMSSLIVPMMIKDEVLGTLEVQAHDDEAFNQEHAVALEMAANLAAVAIENVRLIDTEASAREAAESANRAKDEFLSVLSHELRTPLNAMLGWVRMLKAGVLDEENSERALEVIERNTRLQGSLIEDLLDVSRIISGKMRIETELVDLASVVKTASETIRPLADAKEVSYRFTYHEESIFLTADSVRLQQVVSNLLQNAIKFTPAGGSMDIELDRNETNAVLDITDTGVGIGAELLPHIFDRFRQADASARRNFTGLGLGLTIVRNIVELHGGTIDVRSDGKDKGSTFTLTLPLASDFYNTLNSTDQPEMPSTGSLEGKTILLVDDDTENLLPLKIFLESEKADVTPAANATEALRHLAERDFHLMITDIGMPEIDGYELVSRLRSDSGARNAALKAIALTAYTSVDDRERALDSGFQAHLAKPVNFEELLTTIERISRNVG